MLLTKVVQLGGTHSIPRNFSQTNAGMTCPTCLGKKTMRINGTDRKCFDCRGTGLVSAGGYDTKGR